MGEDQAAIQLARLGAGDLDEPVVLLHRQFAPRIYSLGVRLLGDRGAAEELVQDTFVRLWRAADRFDPARGSAEAFVLTIARRSAIDVLRRRAARPRTEPEGADQPDGAAGEAVDRLLTGLAVRDALAALSPAHREVLELAYRGDLSRQRIAELLDIPVGTVKARIHHALRALRDELEERETHG